jgi:hypothetical protein
MIDLLSSLLIISFLVLIPGFEDQFSQTTNETGLNFMLVEHSDHSVMLYAWDNDTTNVGLDGYPDRLTPLKGYANELALYGPNGVKDVLAKVSTWNFGK